MKYDYPITPKLVEVLKKEYRNESIEKGNTWRKECTYTHLIGKLREEFKEVIDSTVNKFEGTAHIQDELIDLILVASMIYEVIETDRHHVNPPKAIPAR